MFTAFTLLLKISMHVQVIYFLIFLIFWKAFWTEIFFIDFGSPKKSKKNVWKVIHGFLFAFVSKVAENVFWAIRALFGVPSSLLFHLTFFFLVLFISVSFSIFLYVWYFGKLSGQRFVSLILGRQKNEKKMIEKLFIVFCLRLFTKLPKMCFGLSGHFLWYLLLFSFILLVFFLVLFISF